MGRINIWIVLLLVSVALNGVLIGAGARSWFGPAEAPRAEENVRPGRGGFDLRGFLEALPPEARQEARARFEAQRPELRRLARETVQTRVAAMRAVAAEDFDPETAAARLDEARRARAALETRTEALVLGVAADLDPEERRAALRAAMGPDRLDRRRRAPRDDQ
ncbi:MAG: periplasmic heavy metal sensor [Oceanicaulis sp.]